MALKIEKLKLDGTTYEIRELPVKIILPLSNRMAEGGVEVQLELLGASVSVDGKLLGTDAGELGSSAYMKLIKKVLEVNGMTGGELGNES
jgi:hypothetical protein